MAQFSYKARSRQGEVLRGVLDAADRAGALSQLQKQGLFPVAVESARGGTVAAIVGARSASQPVSGDTTGGLKSIFRRKRKARMQDLATYTQQLANLLHSGMPLTVALNSMTHLGSKGITAETSAQLKQDVMEGKSLSEAMARHPDIFTDLCINMVRAGEESGALEEVLRRLASHYQRFAEVQSKFISAMIYPAIVSCVGLVIIIFFVTFMLPKFKEMFEQMGAALPTSTRLLIAVGDVAVDPRYWGGLLAAMAAAFILFVRYKATPAGRRRIDEMKLKMPVFGKVVKLNLFGQFARTLSTLLSNGVPVLTAMKITEDVVPNVILKEAIAMTREEVTDGKTIAQPLAKSGVFPNLMIDLIRIGEDTGDVPGSLENLAETYENELGLALRVMTNLIEPVMIITMAIGVGGLLFSILSALFAITSNIAR